MLKNQKDAASTGSHCEKQLPKSIPNVVVGGVSLKPMKFLLEDYLKEKYPAKAGQRGYFSEGTLL